MRTVSSNKYVLMITRLTVNCSVDNTADQCQLFGAMAFVVCNNIPIPFPRVSYLYSHQTMVSLFHSHILRISITRHSSVSKYNSSYYYQCSLVLQIKTASELAILHSKRFHTKPAPNTNPSVQTVSSLIVSLTNPLAD